MSFRRRMILLAAGAVAAAIVLASVVVYVVTRNELQGQLDASLRAKITPGQQSAVQIQISGSRSQLAKLAKEGKLPLPVAGVFGFGSGAGAPGVQAGGEAVGPPDGSKRFATPMGEGSSKESGTVNAERGAAHTESSAAHTESSAAHTESSAAHTEAGTAHAEPGATHAESGPNHAEARPNARRIGPKPRRSGPSSHRQRSRPRSPDDRTPDHSPERLRRLRQGNPPSR